MTEIIRTSGLLALTALALTSLACDDTIEVPNRAPEAAFDTLEADGEILDIYYTLSDLDEDDLDVALSICFGGPCVTSPTAAPGGDGVTSLPTRRDQPVLHLFRWAAGCDVAATDYQASAVVRIVPSDDEDEGAPIESAAFTLTDLGVVEGCPTVE